MSTAFPCSRQVPPSRVANRSSRGREIGSRTATREPDVARAGHGPRQERCTHRPAARRTHARGCAGSGTACERAAGGDTDPGTDAELRAQAGSRRGDLPCCTAVDDPACHALCWRPVPQHPHARRLTTNVAAPALDLFAPATAPALALLGSRISGLVLIAPTLSARTVPAKHRAVLVMLLTALLAPVAIYSMQSPARITPETMLAEMVIGFSLGLGAAVIVAGAEAAGESIANQIGLSGAAILDPLNNTSVPALGQ